MQSEYTLFEKSGEIPVNVFAIFLFFTDKEKGRNWILSTPHTKKFFTPIAKLFFELLMRNVFLFCPVLNFRSVKFSS
jgi:hypothetical protein